MTTPASRRPCSMVSAPRLGAEVRAPGTRGTPGRAAGSRAQARPGTAWPCTLDLPRALALPLAAGSRAGVPWPRATGTWGGCAGQAARSGPRRPLSARGPRAAASARLGRRSPQRGSEGTGGSSVLPASAAPAQPGAQPAVPALRAATDYYSRASGIRQHLGSCSSQVPGEVKAQLPRDALLSPKGIGLWKTPFSSLSEAGSFRLGLYPVPFAGNQVLGLALKKARHQSSSIIVFFDTLPSPPFVTDLVLLGSINS